jgi:hypothetical protein
MVPGMTERERLAADVRRLDWFADARFAPAGTTPPSSETERNDVPRLSPPARLAAAASRRASLVALGGVVTGFAFASPKSEARKGGKKNKARKKCLKQVEACRAQLRDFCEGNAACEAEILPCCASLADCQAGETVECAFAYLEQ